MALLSEYGFNERSGLVSRDSSGNSRHLVASNASSSWTDNGRSGSAARLQHTGLVGPNVSQTTWTMMAWIRRTGTWASLWAAAIGVNGCIVEANASAGYQLNFFGGSNSNTSAATLALDTWVHVAVTRDAAGSIFYVNGASQGAAVANPAQNFGTGTWFAAGTAATSGDDADFAGDVEDLRFFDVVLSPAEIAAYALLPALPGSTMRRYVDLKRWYGPGQQQRPANRWPPSRSSDPAPLAGTVVAVGQPSTVDDAQPVTRLKTRTVGQPATTDTAQPLLRSKLRSSTQPSTTDSALPAARQKVRLVGQPATVDVAFPVLVRPLKVPVGQPSTTDTALPVTRRKTRNVTQPSTTDIAQPVGRLKTRVLVLVSTTDTSQPVVRVKLKAAGQPSTTDVAQPVTKRKARTVTQPSTTDSVLPATRVKRRTPTQPATADTAFSAGRLKLRLVGQPFTTDTARPVSTGGSIKVTVGQPSTTDVALPVGRLKRRTAGQPASSDVALPVTRRKVRLLVIVGTVDVAQRVFHPIVVRVGQPVTTDQALPVLAVLLTLESVGELTGHLAGPRLQGSITGRLAGVLGGRLSASVPGRLTGHIPTTDLGGSL